MYHSVYFDNFNSYSDWHLVPDTRPVIEQPDVKNILVSVPGGQGVIDLSESLTNYPLYDTRTGQLKFNVLNDCENWEAIYQKISNNLHGKYGTLRLEDDPTWYYQGRFKVGWESPNDGTWSKVNIDYELDPFKYSTELTTMSVTSTANGTKSITIKPTSLCMPTIIRINVPTMSASSLTFTMNNPELNLTYADFSETIGISGNSYLYGLPLSNMSGNNSCILRVKTTGSATTFTINYRKQAL